MQRLSRERERVMSLCVCLCVFGGGGGRGCCFDRLGLTTFFVYVWLF